MAFEDQTLRCRDCSADFIWTTGEQEFFQQKGLMNQPQRCSSCRAQKRSERGGMRKMYDVVCADCGKATQVPFEPRESRPVYCSDCFKNTRVAVS
ncbi:MAG: CxxC-x17-CxxC domain-containing protein [Candidatus Dormibacteria bacterium]